MLLIHLFFSRAVPVEEWIATQLQHWGANLEDIYYARRFNYNPRDKKLDITEYDSASIRNMERTLKKN